MKPTDKQGYNLHTYTYYNKLLEKIELIQIFKYL